MITTIIYIIITFSLDNFFNNITLFNFNRLSIFFPMLVISSLIIIYLLTNKKTFVLLSIIVGFIYDMFYSPIPINTILLFVISLLIIKNIDINKINIFKVLLISVGTIIFYDTFFFLYLNIVGYSNLVLYDLYYKIINSLVLNIIYITISYLIIFGRKISTNKKKRNKRYSYS